jgi:hypothetical protein
MSREMTPRFREFALAQQRKFSREAVPATSQLPGKPRNYAAVFGPAAAIPWMAGADHVVLAASVFLTG